MRGDASQKKRGWQASGPIAVIDPNKLISLAADFDKPGPYVVQFGLQLGPAALASPVGINPVADIRWSVEGGTIFRRVSVGNGTTVQGTGQGVKVYLSDQSVQPPPPATPITTPISYAASILVIDGTRPTQVNPPYLVGPSGVATALGGAVTIPVPQNVGANSVLIQFMQSPPSVPSTRVNANVRQANTGGQLLTIYPLTSDDDIDVWVPLLPNASEITFIVDIDASYTILWGIDG